MRRRVGALLVVATAALAAAAPVAAASGGAALGPFAGYVWDSGTVNEISAAFVVPRIVSRSRIGAHAAEWIGAQVPVDAGPFIQIGVADTQLPSLNAGANRNVYEAFWSNAKANFRALDLFPVRPDDQIAVSMRRLDDGWKLAIVDVTSGRARRFSTTAEADPDFSWAEWIREDPMQGGSQLPFPRLVGGAVRALRVNWQTPSPSALASHWISTPRGDFAPTAIAGGAFGFRRATLSAAATAFLRVATAQNEAAQNFNLAATSWTASTPRSQIAAASAAFAAALRADIDTLAKRHWPARAQALIARLIGELRAALRVVRAAPQSAGAGLAAWTAAYHRAGLRTPPTGRMILAALHAPGSPG